MTDHARFRAFLTGLPGAVLVADADGRVTQANERACALLGEPGETREDLLGRPVTPLLLGLSRRLRLPDPASDGARIDQLLRDGAQVEDDRLQLADGRAIDRDFLPLSDDDGRPVGAAWVYWDVTARYLLDRSRQQAAVAEEAASAQEQVLAVVGHEIRNPVAAISGATELLRLYDLDERTADLVDVIGQSAAHARTILEHLIDHTRLSGGMLQAEPGPVDVRALLTRTARAAELTRPDATAEVRVEVADSVPPFGTQDATRLRQVVLNLLVNALRAAPDGDVVVRASRLGDDRLELSVEDDGIGMSKELLETAFRPFVRGPIGPETEGRQGGLGLGLSIVEQLVALMDGQLSVTSALGWGTTFVIELPFPPTTPKAVEADEPEDVVGEGGVRVLLVEDDPAQRVVLRQMLSVLGAEVRAVASAERAIAVVSRVHVDVVMSDLQLGTLDGLTLARRLRRDGYEGPFVLLTGDVAPALGGETGLIDQHLLKPVRLATLGRCLRQWAPASTHVEPRPLTPGLVDPTLMAAVATVWADALPARRRAIDAAVQAGDDVALRRLLHDLSSTAGMLGDEELMISARRLERSVAPTAQGEAVRALVGMSERLARELRVRLLDQSTR